MIIKNVRTGKYETIKNDHSYYFNIIFFKYNINIAAPTKQTHLSIKEKINYVYNCK